jgi:hypothetical protein
MEFYIVYRVIINLKYNFIENMIGSDFYYGRANSEEVKIDYDTMKQIYDLEYALLNEMCCLHPIIPKTRMGKKIFPLQRTDLNDDSDDDDSDDDDSDKPLLIKKQLTEFSVMQKYIEYKHLFNVGTNIEIKYVNNGEIISTILTIDECRLNLFFCYDIETKNHVRENRRAMTILNYHLFFQLHPYAYNFSDYKYLNNFSA